MKSYHILLLAILVSFIGCSESTPLECKLPKTYSSLNHPVNIKHSDNWKVYEFRGENIAVEYLGLDNFDRRYEAEVLLKFESLDIGETEYYNRIAYGFEMGTQQFLSMADKVVINSGVGNSEANLSDRTWKLIKTEFQGEHEGEKFYFKMFMYCWYSKEMQIKIAAKIKGGEFPEIEPELECIVNNIEITE